MRRSTLLTAPLAAVALVVVGLVACGDREPTERKAFIEFLQTRIVAKPGIHVPKLTADETAAFGPYAAHYAVIADFNGHLDAAVSQPFQKALASGTPRSLGEVVARRQDVSAVRSGFGQIRAALDHELASAAAARAALKQPDDLKPVFAAAYDRDVTQPAKAWAEIFPDVDAAMKSILALADFLDQHRDKITVSGSMLQVADPSLQPRLQALVDALRAKQEAIQKAQQRLHDLAYGS